MATSFILEVGERNLAIDGDLLPPVGTRITVHKHLTDGGTTCEVEVTGHTWRLEETLPKDVREPDDPELPWFEVWIKTKQIHP